MSWGRRRAGPVVVDVNDFPGYRGIPDAPALVAEHLLTRLKASGAP